LDLHRQQITFDSLDSDSGEVWRGRVWQPDRHRFRRWLGQDVARRANGRPVAMAVEGCTGWRYVVEEITAAGYAAHMAEPADTQAARGRKRHAKTDRSDAQLMRELLQRGELPESWIPPTEVLEWRERVRLYKTLVDQRTMWTQRIHAELFQHGVPVPDGEIRAATTRQWLSGDDVELTPAARHRITVGYTMLDATDVAAVPLREQLRRFGMRQPACRALVDAIFGVGGLTAVAVWSELGDCRRFSRSEQAVRHTGLDVTVDASDLRRAGGHLSRQGPSILRWALFEAGMCAARTATPTTPTTARSKIVTTASWRPSPWLASSLDAATTSCAISIPTSSTASPVDLRRWRRPGPPTPTSPVPTAVSSCQCHARQRQRWTAF
jgi:transposase